MSNSKADVQIMKIAKIKYPIPFIDISINPAPYKTVLSCKVINPSFSISGISAIINNETSEITIIKFAVNCFINVLFINVAKLIPLLKNLLNAKT